MGTLTRKQLFILIIVILVAGVALGLIYHNKFDLRLNNGKITVGQDEIMFSTAEIESGFASHFWTEREFIVMDEETYQASYPGEDGLCISLTFPKEISNLKHTYQFTPETEGTSTLHDEVFIGELSYSGTSDEPVISMRQTTGEVKLLNDRGYVQIAVTREKHPLTMDHILDYGGIPFSSKIGGKRAAVGESVSEDGIYENTYQAVIRDIDGKGANCYVTAVGINREHFVYLIRTLCGEKVKAPKIVSAEKDEAVLAAGRKQLAIETAAKQMIYEEYREDIESGKMNVHFMNEPSYIGEIRLRDGKKYNVETSYYIEKCREIGIDDGEPVKRYLFVPE